MEQALHQLEQAVAAAAEYLPAHLQPGLTLAHTAESGSALAFDNSLDDAQQPAIHPADTATP